VATAATPLMEAVAVNRPGVPLAKNVGEVASPELWVVTVAWAEPPS
jgi:hypothetical protein